MNRTEHLLTCLAEECSEVAQRVSKALRFGLADVEPGQELTNAQRICQEMNDLVTIAQILNEEGIVDITYSSDAMQAKRLKVEWFMEYAEKNCGVGKTFPG